MSNSNKIGKFCPVWLSLKILSLFLILLSSRYQCRSHLLLIATTHSADSPGSGDGRHIISDVSPSVEANSTAINSGSSNNPLTSQSVPSSLPANVPMSLSPNCSSTGDNLPST